jgi:hypothetical protein
MERADEDAALGLKPSPAAQRWSKVTKLGQGKAVEAVEVRCKADYLPVVFEHRCDLVYLGPGRSVLSAFVVVDPDETFYVHPRSSVITSLVSPQRQNNIA